MGYLKKYQTARTMDKMTETILNVLGDAVDRRGYLSGCSTQVPPISHWVELGHIDVLLSPGATRKKIEKQADQIVARCGFDSWSFIDNHGDCPNEVRFYVKD